MKGINKQIVKQWLIKDGYREDNQDEWLVLDLIWNKYIGILTKELIKAKPIYSWLYDTYEELYNSWEGDHILTYLAEGKQIKYEMFSKTEGRLKVE